MAEAVRPARRARAKPGRSKAKEKKKTCSEEPRKQDLDDVFIPAPARHEEVSSHGSAAQVEHAEEFTEIRLSDDAEDGQNVNHVFDVPLASLTLAKEGSQTAKPGSPTHRKEFEAIPLHEECRGDPEENATSKLDKPQSFRGIAANESTDCVLSASTFQSSATGTQMLVGIIQDGRTEKARGVKKPAAHPSEELPAAVSQPCKEAKECVQHSKLKTLYPDLSVELSHEKPTIIAVKPLLHSERLYPEILTEPELVPFTKEQLKIFEPFSWLENVDSYVEEFESVAHQERHEFHELLLNYLRCRKQLLLAEAGLQAMTSDCQSAKSRLWTFKEEQQSVQGVCEDQCKVSGHHRYQTVEMNESVLGELKRLFEAKAEHIHQTLALHLYTSVLSRLQVESYIYRLLNSSSLLRSVALQKQEQVPKHPENLSVDLGHLKECISVLFSFMRRVVDDPQFQSDLLLWLQRLVSVLQRVGCPGDHLFLLNHILRCPAGVSKWAVPFIQIKVLDKPSGVFHFMQSLALLMSPVKNRADFMCHMKPYERTSSSGKESGNWTLVDEGGEEDEDPETSWILLLEDDLIVLLSQFPFHELFQHFLGFNAKGDYFPEKTTPQEMMKIFAFADSLVELLAVGLETFNRARYRQFVKRIGHLIKMTLCYVSDHWAQYISCNKQYGSIMHPYTVEKLQLEFDELFLRAVLHVLKAKRLGVWLFMSEMPYGTLSSSMLWKLFFIMHCAKSEHLEQLCATVQLADCKEKLKDPEHLESFEKSLKSINCSEDIYLFTTFAQMAQTKRADLDEDFVRVIVLEIYEVSYVSLYTRETFSKVGRELLGAIAGVHTQIISVLLDRVRETIEKVGMVSLYLFKELPLYLWKPSSSEIALIRDWLLNYNLTAVENKLACIILEGLNWGFGEHDALHLDSAVHAEVALMVLEAYQKYLPQKPYGGLLSESMKQVSYLASIVRYGETPETSFNQWAWGLILRLKLHRNDCGVQQGWPAIPASNMVLDMTESASLHPLLKAVKGGIPIGCYLALAMTTTGHTIEKFCTEGIPLLGILVQSRYLRTVVHVLDKILPLFYPCQCYLLKNDQFLSYIQLFLHVDSGVPQGMTQQVTHKVAQHLTGGSYGENIKLLNSMIQNHIFISSQPNAVGQAAVLEFWVQVLTSPQLWHRDRATLFLMDHLCKAAFQYGQEDCLQKLLYQQHKNALGYHSDKGLLSSLVSWIVAGNVTPSFIEGNANSSQVWFSWTVLNMESIFEEDSQLRRVVEGELVINALTPDQALKKAQALLKLPIVPSLQRLMIYRWAHQAFATPADHPLLPLIWQKFFLLYLHRPGPQYGLPVDGCIGRRFFQSPAQVNLLNEMKQRLIEVADFHHAASKALRAEGPLDGGEGSSEKGSCSPDYLTSPELHKELVRLFNVFVLWLEEESFQKGDTYIPSLPKQYDAYRLAKIMQNQQELWMEYVNIELVQHEFQESLNLWLQVKLESHAASSTSSAQIDFTNPSSAKERIMSNLKKYDAPRPPLPLQPVKAPVPVISSTSLVNQKEAMQLMRMDLNVLQQHAKAAALWESQHVAFNSEILEMIPKLYINREEQITLKLECRGSSNKSCQGAALVAVQFEGKHKNEAINQQLHALRKEVKQLQAEATKPPSLSVVEAAVHVENFITALINIYKVQPMPGIQKVGISLFFAVVEFVCAETQRHPPTKQFFTSCIEILGQVFISGTKSECRLLLQTILQHRRLCNLLSPYFTPVASPNEFVHFYEKVVAFLSEDNSDVVFMLLTKFDLAQWLNITRPPLSERTRLLESIHLALNACGLEPEEDILMPFNIFCKHWTCLIRYQFPDHYSDFLRLFLQSSSEQLLSPECWKASLKTLGCCSSEQGSFKKSDSTESAVLRNSANLLLSIEQVTETIEWLSNSFSKLRLASLDFRTFGLFSKWSPYVAEVNIFLEYLVKRLIDSEVVNLAQEPVGSSRILSALQSLYAVIAELFKPWILVLDKDDVSNERCYPWLESDTPVASSMVHLFTDCIEILHQSFKDKLLPSHHGALWLHLMHYCESCTAPKMPEFILYTFHTEFTRLPWKEMHPDQMLMEEFFKVERGSPKSCFLFLGSVLCEINWVSVLSDAWNPSPLPETHSMIVCLLYMMVLLAKEEQLLSKEESPLINLLGQTSSLPWQLVGIASYQSIINYFSSHYPPSIILTKDTAAELIVKLLKISAGFGSASDSHIHLDATLKCRAYVKQVVQFLSTLEQNGKITLSILEQEMSQVLDDIVIFNPPDMDMQTRHMALSSLFTEALMMMNNASVTTAESLRGSLRRWTDTKVHGLLVLPLLTAACQSLASVRHMAETTEACIAAYFSEEFPLNQNLGWGPILASLQVPELTMEEFLQECLSLGSYLTLYVYMLQCLNTDQTLTNELKMLRTVSKWLEQVYPSSVKEEAKLFLWWHKALQLSLIQTDQNDAILIESVIRILLSIQGRQNQLAEERLSSGILGAIGLGRKSPLSPRFRVVARSMSAFLLVQIPTENQIRLKPGSELHLSQKAQQALNTLESMGFNKQYMEYQEQLSQASQFIKHPGHCLQDGKNLLALLINTLYPEVRYLDIIR
ncbi:ectopic P granules protein 5 homolog isoform X1 [Alligator mississippiensis]|uniref:Ectopic P granules 5-like protein n=2 Tax=Alligator mississippiensis TaxID=8496 RepID=A0A151MWD6_ALLMI|nr:ectopic P granules protein 5 homolog isoform X1 [Alligator mississippiensis]KYO28856.1 ectopic P granules 5-like protein [Alligator mississippiensis]